jgi:hypothetical protein
MSSRFKKVDDRDDWVEYRRPDCKEFVVSHESRDRDQHTYYEAMAEIENTVEGELVAAQKTGCTWIMFIHGWSTVSGVSAALHRWLDIRGEVERADQAARCK